MKDYKTMAMSESHEDDVHLKLYYQLRPYLTNHYISTEEKILMAIGDFLRDDQNEEDHFVKRMPSRGDEITSYITYLSNEIMKVLITNKYPTSKSVKLTWDKEKTFKTQNGILVRYTNDRKYISLKTLTPWLIIMSIKDSKVFFKELNIEIDTLTSPQLYKLIWDHKLDPKNDCWKKFKTLKTIDESLLTELEIDTYANTTETTTTYEIGKGFNKFKQKSINKQDKTFSVFDDL